MPGMEVFDWIMFADDDAYMLPDNVQRMIMRTIEIEKNLTTVFACAVCGSEECWGICGGGGYLMNRETLFEIVNGGNKTAFPSIRDETAFYDKRCGQCGDLSIARVIEDIHHIRIKDFAAKGNYIWDVAPLSDDDEGYKMSLQLDGPQLPWFYHYPAKDKFRQFHAWVDEFGSNKELED